jgi:hypothetical protein
LHQLVPQRAARLEGVGNAALVDDGCDAMAEGVRVGYRVDGGVEYLGTSVRSVLLCGKHIL